MSTPAGDCADRERHRAAVAGAMLTLLNEGRSDPSLSDVAARVGLSVDVAFRHFDGADDLRQEVIALHLRRVEQLLVAADVRHGPIGDRAERFVEARLEFCATMAGAGRIAHARAQVPEIADGARRVRDLWDAHARAQFAPELSGLDAAQAAELIDTIDGRFRFDVWDDLVSVQGRSAEQIGRAWRRTLLTILTTDPTEDP